MSSSEEDDDRPIAYDRLAPLGGLGLPVLGLGLPAKYTKQENDW